MTVLTKTICGYEENLNFSLQLNPTLTRQRIGAHTLTTELLRRNQHSCAYCQTTETGANKYILIQSNTLWWSAILFRTHETPCLPKWQILYPVSKISQTPKSFSTLMCPTMPQIAKNVNRYIKYKFKKDKKQAGAALCHAQHSLA